MCVQNFHSMFNVTWEILLHQPNQTKFPQDEDLFLRFSLNGFPHASNLYTNTYRSRVKPVPCWSNLGSVALIGAQSYYKGKCGRNLSFYNMQKPSNLILEVVQYYYKFSIGHPRKRVHDVFPFKHWVWFRHEKIWWLLHATGTAGRFWFYHQRKMPAQSSDWAMDMFIAGQEGGVFETTPVTCQQTKCSLKSEQVSLTKPITSTYGNCENG